MAKDPALLIYTKDFLEGTADLSVEEFGAYTRLIFHQHQRGFLPKELKKLARLSGTSLQEFEIIWKEINIKFSLSDHGFFNERCSLEISKRAKDARLKSVLAVYGNWLKYHKTLTKQQKFEIKSEFSSIPFLDIDDEKERKEKITKTLNKIKLANAKRTHIANGDAIVIVNEEVISAYEFLKKESPGKIEVFEMQNKSSFENYDTFKINFNSKVITDELEFDSKILYARLEQLNANWRKKEIKAMDSAVIEKIKKYD